MKWVHDTQWNPARCTQVEITPTVAHEESYLEFPSTPGLADFDPADRKFIAAAVVFGPAVEILQATDSRWWPRRAELAAAGVTVRFICEEEVAVRGARRSV